MNTPEWAFELSAAADEAEFLQRWQTYAAGLQDPLEMAVAGGFCADRLAWVFVAGYQAAIRRTFPRTSFSGWAAFAVSEKDTHLQPGVDWQQHQDTLLLSGHKTWIAASRSVSDLVIKAGRGERARYCLVAEGQSGVTLTHKDSPGMLPDLSQGEATLHEVVVSPAQQLPTEHVAAFSGFEALYIYSAFLAYLQVALQKLGGIETYAREIARGLSLAAQAHELPSPKAHQAFADLTGLVQDLRGRTGGSVFAADPAWQRDQRLIAMYAR